MFSFLRPDRRSPEDSAQQALDRAVAVLRRYERAGMPSLPVTEVLEMLGAGPEEGPEPGSAPRDPRADPLTGARWAGAPGSSPPAAP